MRPYYTKYNKRLSERSKYTSVVTVPAGKRRYFSSLECEFYFGSKQFKDMVELAFFIDESPRKIYGYNSYFPNLLIPGRKEIQGSFKINFIKGGGFKNFLYGVEDSIRQNNSSSMFTKCPYNNPTWGGKLFDLLIGYGYYKGEQTYNATCQCLLGVMITGMTQHLDTSGNPIIEEYRFVAKDYTEKDFSELNDEDNSGDYKEEAEDENEQVAYKIEDKGDTEQFQLLQETCKNNPETIGIVVDARHNLTKRGGSDGNISVSFELWNIESLDITDVTIDILDQRVKTTDLISLENEGVKDISIQIFDSEKLNSETSKSINTILKSSKNSVGTVRIKLSFKCEKLSDNFIKESIYLRRGENY